MSLVKDYIQALSGCLEELKQQNIEEIADIIFEAYKKGKRIFLMGNGGSATTASHLARDLRMGTALDGKPRIQTLSLTDSQALITAIANDKDYSCIFEEQLIGQVGPGDVVIAISASGNSPNVLKAIEYARQAGATTIGLTGFGGGKLRQIAHRSITLSRQDYGQVEDIHLCLAHMIAYLLKEKMTSA